MVLGRSLAALLVLMSPVLPATGSWLVHDVSVLDGQGGEQHGLSVLIEGERIVAVAEEVDAADDVTIIDGAGRWITPGIIDVHTHLGMASVPYVPVELASWDVNELSDPHAAHVRAIDAINPGDPAFARALAAGVTTVQVLPGSANLFGGLGVVLSNRPGKAVSRMQVTDARPVLKMACGENPKYTWGPRGKAPATRMGTAAEIRRAMIAAREWREDGEAAHDEGMARLAAVLDGEVDVHMHCYTAHEMLSMMALAEELGFRIAVFHHAAEAYKIPAELAEHGACVAVWAELWGFKMETLDSLRANAALAYAGGACVMLHSDIPVIGERLHVEVAKARAEGERAGLEISRGQAFTWLTGVPAQALGLSERLGQVTPGYQADLVLWSGDPFSVQSRPDSVWIAGERVYERKIAPEPTDFELGQPARVGLP